MSENIAKQTMAAIYNFCDLFIDNETAKQEILMHISNIFKNWPESWIIIKKWLREIIFVNKEQVILNFIDKIPELQVFKDIIIRLLKVYPTFWDEVYKNLVDCKECLYKE